MGLLEKIINKEIHEEKKQYTKAEIQSFFKKVENILSSSDNIETDQKKKIENFSSVIKKFKKKKKNLSAPLDVFNIFVDYFSLAKGSLLILNQSCEYFSAWALAGYDYTTANRLRIPEQDVKNIFSEETKPLVLNSKLLKKINKYFSSREFANLDSVLFIPFFTNNNDLFAFLMFSDFSGPANDKTFSDILNNYDIFYPVLNDALLHFFNSIKINPNPAIFIKHDKIYGAIKESIKKYNYSNPFVLFFDGNKFLDSVSGVIDKNFKNNFYNNIIDLFSSFVSNNGNIFIADNNTISILKDAPSLNDKDMIAYQISFFIKNLIPQPLDDQAINSLITVFRLPEEDDTLKQFLND